MSVKITFKFALCGIIIIFLSINALPLFWLSKNVRNISIIIRHCRLIKFSWSNT